MNKYLNSIGQKAKKASLNKINSKTKNKVLNKKIYARSKNQENFVNAININDLIINKNTIQKLIF